MLIHAGSYNNIFCTCVGEIDLTFTATELFNMLALVPDVQSYIYFVSINRALISSGSGCNDVPKVLKGPRRSLCILLLLASSGRSSLDA